MVSQVEFHLHNQVAYLQASLLANQQVPLLVNPLNILLVCLLDNPADSRVACRLVSRLENLLASQVVTLVACLPVSQLGFRLGNHLYSPVRNHHVFHRLCLR